MISTTRSDMADDYDRFQPCFYETEMEEEFYDDTPSPSHDIWKKFELLPTPPRSPRHQAFEDDDDTLSSASKSSSIERLKLVLETLDDDLLTQTVLQPWFNCCGNLKSKLIQDCMWSAPQFAALLAASPVARDAKAAFTNCDTAPVSKLSVSDSVDINVSTDCVDPMAVFPYPLSAKPAAAAPVAPVSRYNSVDTPSDSDDEDEIDVVTVGGEKTSQQSLQQSRRRKQILPAARSHSAHVAAIHSYSSMAAPPSHTPTHHRHHKRASSPGQRSSKRHRGIDMDADATSSSYTRLELRNADSDDSGVATGRGRTSDDSDEESVTPANSATTACGGEGKRAQHNVLERKRRDDLKSSFNRLRDAVPEMQRRERTPKVVILRNAANHIRQVTNKHGQLNDERERLRHTHKLLKERLRVLRAEHFL